MITIMTLEVRQRVGKEITLLACDRRKLGGLAFLLRFSDHLEARVERSTRNQYRLFPGTLTIWIRIGLPVHSGFPSPM